jgi:hypothetical protein
MTKTASNRFGEVVSNIGCSLKSMIKLMLKSKTSTISSVATNEDSVIIMGNGPSLNDTIAQYSDVLMKTPTLAVNFAANAPQFQELKPRYYVLADPHFFVAVQDVNVLKLRENLVAVDWPMTLFVPFEAKKRGFAIDNPNIKIEYFNFLAVEGFEWLENWAYSSGRGMPRPRNVLIPSIMVAMKMGFGNIYITGADHSWTKTLSVNERNEVVSIQPHFYKEDENEEKRVRVDYLKYPLHQIVYSFYVAFKSYHSVQRYALHKGVDIYNATPESFIDAFPRKSI